MKPRYSETLLAGVVVALAAVGAPAQDASPVSDGQGPAAPGSTVAAAGTRDPVSSARTSVAAAAADLAAGRLAEAEEGCRRGLLVLEATGGDAADAVRLALHDTLGHVLYEKGQAGESVVAFRAEAALARALGDPKAEAAGLLGIATGEFVLARYAEALEAALAALRIAEEASLGAAAAQSCHLAGLIHRNLGQPQEALPLLQRAADLARAAGDAELLVRALNEQGNALHELGDDATAIARKHEAMELAERSGDEDGFADCVNDLAVIAYAQGRLAESTRYLEQAFAISSRVGDHRERVIGAVNLAGAVSEADPTRARALLEEALKVAVTAQLPVEEELVRETLALEHAQRGDHAEAYRELLRAHELRRSTLTAASTRRVADLRALYDAERREAEIALLQRDREIQRLTAERARVRQRWWAAGFGVALLFAVVLGAGYQMRTRSARALAEAKSRVDELARTDPLTGLANRRFAVERLHDEALRAQRRQSVFSLVLADLDDFKRVNDAHGHACGDEVLVRFSGILSSSVRALDVAARWGGEEFLLLLPGTDAAGAVNVAEKVRARLQELEVLWQDAPVRLTATLGVAVCRDGDAEACLRAADAALYAGKAAGRNVVFTAEDGR
jgi:diguanylate cyclase (GGDEF)-like protein